MSYTDITVSAPSNGIQWISLNRPKVKNATRMETYAELDRAFHAAEHNAAVSVLVLTGSEDYFTSGADWKSMLGSQDARAQAMDSHNPCQSWMHTVVRFPKILVCAVNGPAVGIGVTLLPHCDFVYAVEGATFWTPFVRIGLAPEFGASATFPALMGKTLTNEVFMAGRKLTSEEALKAGLVGEVFPKEEFSKRVEQKLAALVTSPTPDLQRRTLIFYKRLGTLHSTQDLIHGVIDREWDAIRERQVNGDTAEALQSMMAQLQKAKL